MQHYKGDKRPLQKSLVITVKKVNGQCREVSGIEKINGQYRGDGVLLRRLQVSIEEKVRY